MQISTPRLILRNWREEDRAAFAVMHGDAEVMHDLGGPFDQAHSDTKFDRYVAAYEQHGFCRWAVLETNGQFVGYTGIMPHGTDHRLGPHADVGWRLVRSAWGHGYAEEAAEAALEDGVRRLAFEEVFAYTTPDNLRSQSVMARLGLIREPHRDFTLPETGWRGLVWTAKPDG